VDIHGAPQADVVAGLHRIEDDVMLGESQFGMVLELAGLCASFDGAGGR
jgi:hypothetical protein